MSARPPAVRGQEVDVWWGSFAGRTLTPSFALCTLLTALIFWGTRTWVAERGWVQLSFFGFAGALWLVQLTRWARRFFSYNYRLTTRFLYVDRGFLSLVAQRLDLRAVQRLQVRADWLQNLLGVGDVEVYLDGDSKPAAVLQGLLAPARAADTLREAVKKARTPDA
jgi:uncharacterized membrane protein YdbT with pleckstrin-like domain